MQGETNIVEETYLYLPGIPGGKVVAESLGVDYFAVPVIFGKNGAQKVQDLGPLSEYEQRLLKVAVTELKSNILKGVEFVNSG